ncbi:MAG: hypothetical protein JWM56_794 [Candidatus Peribacteria bacterium]|nr:hypothetical protein [Candidatus Peribacteria bacterium]
MHLTPYQIVAPAFSLFAILYAWNLVLRQKKTLWEAFFWTLFWGLVTVIALFPRMLTYLSAVTGIANQENAVLITFMGILFFIVFYIIIRLEELEQRHTKIVRLMALREAGLDTNNDMAGTSGTGDLQE